MKNIKHNKLESRYKILLTGGGTAGHISPILAIYEELRSYSYKYHLEFLFVGTKNSLEEKIIKENHLPFKGIYTGKLRRYFSLENLVDPFKLIIGLIQSYFLIKFFKPKVVFAKGGYVTFPVVLAAKFCKIPVVIHESDVIMGLANKIESKIAQKICLGFPVQYYNDLPVSKIVYTGNPVKKEFLEKIKNQKSKTCLPIGKIKNKLPTILITGGSQGSRFINQSIAAILGELTKKYAIIHISGKLDYPWLKKNNWPNYSLYDFTDKMPELMAKSDLIISRASASTMAEISCLGKPSILIPLSSSAGGHQMANAKIYEKRNAAIVLSEDKITPEGLGELINRLMEDKKLLETMGNLTKELFQPNAAEIITEEIVKFF